MASTLGGYSKNNLLEAIAAWNDPGLLQALIKRQKS
jgi:hypothetical protein